MQTATIIPIGSYKSRTACPERFILSLSKEVEGLTLQEMTSSHSLSHFT